MRVHDVIFAEKKSTLLWDHNNKLGFSDRVSDD